MTDDSQPDFTIRNGDAAAHFRVRKLLAEEAFETLETLRVGLKDALDLESGDSFGRMVTRDQPADGDEHSEETQAEMAGLILRLLLAVPRETLASLKASLFSQVYYRTGNVQSWTRLAGNESGAFAELEPVHVYQVIARAFTINFRGSWGALQSLIPAMP